MNQAETTTDEQNGQGRRRRKVRDRNKYRRRRTLLFIGLTFALLLIFELGSFSCRQRGGSEGRMPPAGVGGHGGPGVQFR